MEIQEFLKYRTDLLEESKDEEGFIQQSLLLSRVLPLLVDAKLLDSEDWNDSYYIYSPENLKLNGYTINESGERLQLFLVDENTIDINISEEELKISTKGYYENQFKRSTKFLNKAIKGHLNDEIQDADPIRPLVSQVSSGDGANQFDVMEIFLISASATTETRGSMIQPRRIEFEDETILISYSRNKEKIKKELVIKKKLIDLNFLYSVFISQGNREALIIDFEKNYNYKIEVIKAAEELNFESYLCVLPASILANLYKDYSSRLLEKNVRSFLQFKGANKGIKDTIKSCPEKFIAFNNGITITCTAKELEVINGKSFIKKITDFQIVNGGQTTAGIYFTHKDGFSIEKVKVMAKINVAKDVSKEGLDELISDISKYSNSQTRVSTVDLDSRNPQLIRLKALSESVMTPSGRKWFFEKSRGEFYTKLRIAGKNKSRVLREYPKKNRFSKEQLGKYYTAWGIQPHVVKKGGEKVFRYFLEDIKNIQIDRLFYENLISKMVLFNELEEIYGQGKKSIGQIRSVVVPYSISILYKYTNDSKKNNLFDLIKIWKSEGLEEDLKIFFNSLMILMNDLIKKYSPSDDFGEYSKKVELWNTISECIEIKEFINQDLFKQIYEKYTISKEALKKRETRSTNNNIDFQPIQDTINVYSNSILFYKNILNTFYDTLKSSEKYKIEQIIFLINNHQNLNSSYLLFEKELINSIRINSPEFFDLNSENKDITLQRSFDFILKKYNSIIESSLNMKSEFSAISEMALRKGAKYHSVFDEIGNQLEKGIPPSIKQLYYASNYISLLNEE